MSKVFKVIGAIAGVVAMIPGPWQLPAAIVSTAASIGSSLLAKKPQSPATSQEQTSRLQASIDPRTPRKMVFGSTAMATDIRDQEWSNEQEYLHRFIVVASHKVHAIRKIWFDDKLAWSSTGGVQGEFAGYLTVQTRLEGSAANAINIGSRMGSSRRYTGCAYVYLKFKLTGNSKKANSPFAQSIASRVTIEGDGAFMYDPRLDSTVPGGSGSCRADDQSTWIWNENAGRNPALHQLWYMLGWRINGKLAVGKGIPPKRINLESYIAAANLCDELVGKSAGGTEPRYRSDGVFSEGDPPLLVLNSLKSAMNAELDDVDGKIRVQVLHNDLALPVAHFTEDDIIGDVDWRQTPELNESFNIVRGTYINASPQSLYQAVDYPQVELESRDGIDRIFQLDGGVVQSASQMQRLAKPYLQRQEHGGIFSATFQATAWRVQKGDIITLTFGPLGFITKLFRVVEMEHRVDGTVPVVLREEHASIYQWDNDDAPAVVAAAPTDYDFSLNPILDAIVNPVYADGVSLEDIRAQLEASLADILALAASKGRVTTGPTPPSSADSHVGDTHILPDGTFLLRVPGSRILGGNIVTLGGYRPALYWTYAEVQPLRSALATAGIANSRAGDALIAAAAAQADATAARNRLAIIDDNAIIDRQEKTTRLIPEVAQLEHAYGQITATATGLGLTFAPLTSARAAFQAFLGGLNPAWNDDSVDTPVARGSLDAALKAYTDQFDILDKQIKERAAVTAEWSRIHDDDGGLAVLVATAESAQLQADQASIDAADAQLRIEKIVGDGYLDKSEKPDAKLRYDAAINEQAGIQGNAVYYGITTERSAYDNAVSALTAYLTNLSPAWDNGATDTAIDRATYKAKWQDFYDARQALLNRIAEEASRNVPLMTVSTGADILCDYQGNPKTGQLPITLTNARSRGNARVDHLALWSATAPVSVSATIDNTSANIDRGDITITAITGDGEITVSSSHDGVTLTDKIKVRRILDNPPPPPPSSGATQATSSAAQSADSTSYPSTGLRLGPVAAGSAGQIRLEAYLNFYRDSIGTNGAYGKWGYATSSSGPFTDIPEGEVASETSAVRSKDTISDPVNDPGTLSINQIVTSLTSGTDYWFELRLRLSSGSVNNVFYGDKIVTRL